MNRTLDVTTSVLSTLARGGTGSRVGAAAVRPPQLLELYEFEACPFCRKVREALTILDLDAMIHPCPKGGPGFREEVRKRGGRAMFPYLVDPNTGTEMYESDDIVAHLFREYGDGRVPFALSLGPLTIATASLASAFRPLSGLRYRESEPPELPLELYSYEASPFSRLARECLSSLELRYRLHNVARGSAGRDAFVERSGRMMVPFLVDPNTGVEMFESADIVRYLEDTYAR
ncbi:MAG: glutathione S-transferase N-terminal domain-containing protein [Deltaproteobacteria bacterium]|nr:glutathione S-transferase N-terminal domain-containing protein [Deltaproteobacteria bacterium]MBW2666588.1 glutathione S-transferase N-terminal domain-containing protein [Deltaproteobacteria bacterium]